MQNRKCPLALFTVGAAVFLGLTPLALATKFRLPLAADGPVHYYFDRDPRDSIAVAWNGSTTATYDGHTGTDFSGLPRGTPVFAAADGILVEKADLYEDSDATTENGNFVRLNHGNDKDGIPIVTVYCHLAKGSVTMKAIGNLIACGEQIGGIGASGHATGPHLHFAAEKGLRGAAGAFDPFAIPDTGEISWWVDQGTGSPSTACAAPKFIPGDTVQVVNVGPGSLFVRAPDSCSASFAGSKHGGDTGVVLGGPSLCDSGTGYYTRWRIHWNDGVEGWSAENWLEKTSGTSSGVQIASAVLISWPAAESTPQQVYESSDLANWTPIGQTLTGDGGSVKTTVPLGNSATRFFKVEALPGWSSNRFSALQQIDWSAASITATSDGVDFSNMRLSSSTTTPDDLVDANFVFDQASQVFRLASYSVASGVGVYNDPYFAKDVPVNVLLATQSGQNYQMNQDININLNGTQDFYFNNLQVGHVISWFLNNIWNADVRYQFLDPDGTVEHEFVCPQNGGVISSEIPILKQGKYTLRLSPFGATSASLTLRFLNANRQTMAERRNGDYVSFQFAVNLDDYCKFKVNLQKGQLLALAQPSDSNIKITILNEQSQKFGPVKGLPVKFVAAGAGWHYIFVDNQNGWGGSYSSTVSITQAPPGLVASLTATSQKRFATRVSAAHPSAR